MRPTVLFHFTNTAEGLVNILNTRFEFIHRSRNLIDALVPGYSALGIREPQAFGMISLTEDASGGGVKGKFGEFGIAVTMGWALSRKALPVQYIDPNASMFQLMVEEFRLAFEDLKVQVAVYPDDGFRKWAYWNRKAAWAIGAHRWDEALTQYEFMEHSRHAKEREWRIVNDLPGYAPGRSEEAPARSKRFAAGFANRNNLTPSDIAYLMCPSDRVETLRRLLPVPFHGVEIRCT